VRTASKSTAWQLSLQHNKTFLKPFHCRFVLVAATSPLRHTNRRRQNRGSSRTGTHGNAVPVLFYTTVTSFPFFFSCILQLLTVIFHGSPSVIKLIRLLPAFMHVNSGCMAHGHSGVYDMIMAHGHSGACHDSQSRKCHAMEE